MANGSVAKSDDGNYSCRFRSWECLSSLGGTITGDRVSFDGLAHSIRRWRRAFLVVAFCIVLPIQFFLLKSNSAGMFTQAICALYVVFAGSLAVECNFEMSILKIVRKFGSRFASEAYLNLSRLILSLSILFFWPCLFIALALNVSAQIIQAMILFQSFGFRFESRVQVTIVWDSAIRESIFSLLPMSVMALFSRSKSGRC